MKTKNIKIEDGMIMGQMIIDGMNDPVFFEVCSIEEFEKLTEDEAEEKLTEAKNECGYFSYGFATEP